MPQNVHEGNRIKNSIMNRRDIKNKNKIGDAEVGTDNELQPLQGFSEGGFNSNGLNNKFGEFMWNYAAEITAFDLERHIAKKSVASNINMQWFSFNFRFVMSFLSVYDP
jgi:hypothetical protein